ncbi:hypothetical protein TYRP_020218 [Tyrophagus putrescentiae]|nr:hypothetical protein TYRP_020218 [Tyrophagus putrescentiae]
MMITTVHHFLIVLFIILAFTITTFSSAEDEAAAEQLPTSLSSDDQFNVLTNDSSPFEEEDEDGEEGQRGGEEGSGGGFLGVLKYLGPSLGVLILLLVVYCQCCAGPSTDGFLSLKSDRTRRVQKSTYSSDGRDGPSRKTTLASGVSSIGTSAFVAAPKRKMKMKRSKV